MSSQIIENSEFENLKKDNEYLRMKLQEMCNHFVKIFGILNDKKLNLNLNFNFQTNNENNNSNTNNYNLTSNSSANSSNDNLSRNRYIDYENRPLPTHLNNNLEKTILNNKPVWDWENRPIKSAIKIPSSILVTRVNQNTDTTFLIESNRRRSKSVCFAERNTVESLIEPESTNSKEPVIKTSLQTEKPQNFNTDKKIDDNKIIQNKEVKANKKKQKSQKENEKPRIYNLDTSTESDVNESNSSKDNSLTDKNVVGTKTIESEKLNENRSNSDPKSKKDSNDESIESRLEQKMTNLEINSQKNKQSSKQVGILIESNGQNMKCNCSGDCVSNRCGCKKSGSSCGPKCHGGQRCKNH